ncbi:ferritin-like domain-containing protein [Infundibulicybe gibba]|nr:ferritin-like domain-containing protein [Infundibulicybe gibba]
MRYSTFILASAPLLVSAAPALNIHSKRAAIDVTVFKFADVLEQLESSFYSAAISKFQASDFSAAGFTSTQIPLEQFKSIQADEATHSGFLQGALKEFGETPITSCKFNFDSVLTDVATMAATARVVENVGVAAYLGGATLLTNPVFVAAAGSILTVEARHQTILNILSSTGTAIPAAFDVALTPSEVIALAAPFFDGPCDLGVPGNPTLSITNTGTVAPGTQLSFKSAAINGTVSEDKLFCQMLIGGSVMSIPLPFNQCVVPQGINGPVAIWVTSDGQPLLNNVKDRANSQLIAGPTMAFIDTQPQMLGQIARGSPASSGSSGTVAAAQSTSTTTISPAEASALVADSSASGAGAAPSSAATGSAAAASAAAGSASAPNTFKGPSPDGKVLIKGWN